VAEWKALRKVCWSMLAFTTEEKMLRAKIV